MKQIMNIFLSLLMLMPPAYSNPPEKQESSSTFKIEQIQPIFEAAPFDVQLGELDFTAYYLMPGVESPIFGVLIDKDIFAKIEFLTLKRDEWCQLRVDKERSLCDIKLKERDDACKALNKELIGDKLKLQADLSKLEIELKDEEFFSKSLLWIGGTMILGLSGTLVYTSLSK
jgi:hypothetical protein